MPPDARGGRGMFRTAITWPLLLLPFATPAVSASPDSRPPAHLNCSLYIGETHLMEEGKCQVVTLKGSKIRISEGELGYELLIVPDGDRDRIYWNGSPGVGKPKTLLGVAQWLDNCWQSIAHSEPPFSLCLLAPRKHDNSVK